MQKAEGPEDAASSNDDLPAGHPNAKKARTIRLEQNRKAARESRKRKKMMIEELQRSVIFFSRANGTLKQQNDELTRCLMQAQAQVAAIEQGQAVTKAAMAPVAASAPQAQPQQQAPAPQPVPTPAAAAAHFNATSQAQAQAVATQAIYESQGFPPAAARAAAQTMNAGCTTTTTTPTAAMVTTPETAAAPSTATLPDMQTGATMQAMSNFQQAAAAAMQAAMGMNPTAKPMEHQPTYVAPPPPPQYMTWQYQAPQPAYATGTEQQMPTAS